jgi:hypothetical protein
VCYWQDDTHTLLAAGGEITATALRLEHSTHSLNCAQYRARVSLLLALACSIHQYSSSAYENVSNRLKLVYPMSPLGLTVLPILSHIRYRVGQKRRLFLCDYQWITPNLGRAIQKKEKILPCLHH